MYALVFSTTFVRNIRIVGRIDLDMFKNVYLFSCKVLVFLIRF